MRPLAGVLTFRGTKVLELMVDVISIASCLLQYNIYFLSLRATSGVVSAIIIGDKEYGYAIREDGVSL